MILIRSAYVRLLTDIYRQTQNNQLWRRQLRDLGTTYDVPLGLSEACSGLPISVN